MTSKTMGLLGILCAVVLFPSDGGASNLKRTDSQVRRSRSIVNRSLAPRRSRTQRSASVGVSDTASQSSKNSQKNRLSSRDAVRNSSLKRLKTSGSSGSRRSTSVPKLSSAPPSMSQKIVQPNKLDLADKALDVTENLKIVVPPKETGPLAPPSVKSNSSVQKISSPLPAAPGVVLF